MHLVEEGLREFYGPARRRWQQQLLDQFNNPDYKNAVKQFIRSGDVKIFKTFNYQIAGWTTYQKKGLSKPIIEKNEQRLSVEKQSIKARQQRRLAQLKQIRYRLLKQNKIGQSIKLKQKNYQTVSRKKSASTAVIKVVDPDKQHSLKSKFNKKNYLNQQSITANILHSIMAKQHQSGSLKQKLVKQAKYVPKSKLKKPYRQNIKPEDKHFFNNRPKSHTVSLKDLIRLC